MTKKEKKEKRQARQASQETSGGKPAGKAMHDAPQWVGDAVREWASAQGARTGDYEVSFINNGYYLYKKGSGSRRPRAYVGSIKEDGIHAKKECGGIAAATSADAIARAAAPGSASTMKVFEYGFSATVIGLASRCPKWKEFYGDDSDAVLLSVIQAASPGSFTREAFTPPEKQAHHIGHARRLLDSLLPVSLATIMDEVGCVYTIVDGDARLSLATARQMGFFKEYGISLGEVAANVA